VVPERGPAGSFGRFESSRLERGCLSSGFDLEP
jgi:hypothetical protein